tara:strand:+ start:47 stop:640 length:594 start_codon:yes stop_codon:yes gene_type:complete
MTFDILTALMLFALVSSITPGPNNLMLMASGVNYGVKRSLPHMFGVSLGFTLMVALVGLGIMQLFDMFPVTYQILKVLSVTYLLYLAYKIATASNAKQNNTTDAKPMTFFQAVLFQWVNPKAWTMALTAISVYAPSKSVLAVVMVSSVFGAVNFPCISTWTILGQKIQGFLTDDKRLRVFNFTMAGLLVISLYPIFL